MQLNKWADFTKRVEAPQNLAVNHESNNYKDLDLISQNLILSFSYACFVASQKKSNLKILDWGGGIGHYGYIAKSILPEINVEYFCYDLDAFGKAAQEVMPDMHFSADPSSFLNETLDLVIASSSLWYDQYWEATLEKFLTNNTNYIYITRMVFVEKCESFVAIQRPYSMGYKTEYLCWILNKNYFISVLEKLGFSLQREFYFGPATDIYRAPEQGKIWGFLFKRVSLVSV